MKKILRNLFYIGWRMSISMHCKGEWFELVCESYKTDGCQISGVPLPGFPEEQLQVSTTGQSGRDSLCEAFIFYEDCIKKFEKSGNFNKNDKVLVDFGVGWGRILRFFLRDFLPDNMIGVDINTDLLDVCRSTFEFGTFLKSNAMPPVGLQDESVDFIVGFSVFSHLSEAACMAWIGEFKRILRPGGMLALTTRGRWFLDFSENLKTADGKPSALSQMFDDFNKARTRYDNGEFVHSNSKGITGGGPLDGSFYGETFIPERYAKENYSPYFEVLDFDFTKGRSSHPVMFFVKN